MIDVTIELTSPHSRFPEKATEGSAGYDAFACLKGRTIKVRRCNKGEVTEELYDEKNGLCLLPGERALIPLGFKLSFPTGIKCDIWPKSGRAWNEGLTLANAIGLGDSDYPNEYAAIVLNAGFEPVTIWHDQKIVQLTFTRYEDIQFVTGTVEANGERTGGFGSTGLRAKS